MKITFSNIRFMNNKVPDYHENKSTGFMLAARYILLKKAILTLHYYKKIVRTFYLKIYSNCLPLYLNIVIDISCDIQKKFCCPSCVSLRATLVSPASFFSFYFYLFLFLFLILRSSYNLYIISSL